MSATSHRRWFQFSIRSVLVLMTVVCISFGFWVSGLHHKHQALSELRSLNAQVTYGNRPQAGTFFGHDWAKKLFGEGFYDEPVRVSIMQRRGGTPIKDATVQSLGQFPRLKGLSLELAPVGDEGMPYLRRLQKLERLQLRYCPVGDAALTNMSALSMLDTLDLSGTQITDAGLPHLSGLANLKHLILDGTKVTDEGVSSLKDLDHLISLNLGHTIVRGNALQELSARNSIVWLKLSKSEFEDDGLAAIGNFTHLETLLLDGTAVTGEGFAVLVELPVLKELDLSRTTLTDGGLRKLPRLPSLERLILNDTPISDDGTKYLSRLTALESLELRGTKITGETLACLQMLPRLKYLNLNGTQIGDADIDALNEICSLISVSLGGTNVTEAGLAKLKVFGSLDASPADEHVMRTLIEQTEIVFTRAPLADPLDYLKQKHECEIQVDARIVEIGTIRAPVTCDIHDVPLLRGLEEMLAPLGMVVIFRHSVPFITSRPVRPALCIPQRAEGERVSPPLEAALAQSAELDFADQPLPDVLDYLAKRHSIVIKIDDEAFHRAEKPTDVRISQSIKGIPLRSALGLVLEPLDVICVAEGEALIIRPAP